MGKLDPNRTIGACKRRAGEEKRANQERLFYVDNVGWYIHTREGLNGPYPEKEDAQSYVAELKRINKADLSFVDTVQM